MIESGKTAHDPAHWRSLLFVPATRERYVESALKRDADALMLDLEDSVAADQKTLARERVRQIAERYVQAGFGVAVRVNRPWRLLVRDIEACVSPQVHALTLPKVNEPGLVRAVAEILQDCEHEQGLAQGHTRLIVMVEDAEGLENVSAIARAHPRISGLIVGAEDLAVSMRMAVHEDTLYVPNVLALAACRRAGITPVGFIGSVADFADREAFRAKLERAARLGFESAFCIHPQQVDIVNQAFTPAPEAVARARALLAEFDAQCAAGRAACTFEGRMVDAPVAEQARQLLARHEALAARAAARALARG
ncbi:CoA ester lyase [Orrella sp. JC864]|uniref:HpcH/HpaI aldolase/citrate lyase family protein n=1 Tax=Orrella sp. JC864 TaxID=3120298 RepID=UPI00300BBCFB